MCIRDRSSVVQAGGQIRYPVDLSAYKNRVSLTNPDGDTIEAVAAPMKPGGEPGKSDAVETTDKAPDSQANALTTNANEVDSSVLYEAEFPPIGGQGFYEMKLQNNDGGQTPILFAANVDASEGDLTRLSRNVLDGNFFGGNVDVVTSAQLSKQTVKGGSSELWMFALMILFCALVAEQFLGWFWGRKR